MMFDGPSPREQRFLFPGRLGMPALRECEARLAGGGWIDRNMAGGGGGGGDWSENTELAAWARWTAAAAPPEPELVAWQQANPPWAAGRDQWTANPELAAWSRWTQAQLAQEREELAAWAHGLPGWGLPGGVLYGGASRDEEAAGIERWREFLNRGAMPPTGLEHAGSDRLRQYLTSLGIPVAVAVTPTAIPTRRPVPTPSKTPALSRTPEPAITPTATPARTPPRRLMAAGTPTLAPKARRAEERAEELMQGQAPGHDPLSQKWVEAFKKEHGGREPGWEDVQIRLFSIAFPNEWNPSAFYDEQGNYRRGSLELKLRDERPIDRTWEVTPGALERLAAWYKKGEEKKFTRDVGTLFGGLRNRLEEPSAWNAFSDRNNPVHVWVYVNPEGIPSYLIGEDYDANIHHWAWGVAMGGDWGPGGSVINTGREILRFEGNVPNSLADVNMGNLGSALGYNYSLMGLESKRMRDVWNKYMLNRWW